jgi:hypothetical protein
MSVTAVAMTCVSHRGDSEEESTALRYSSPPHSELYKISGNVFSDSEVTQGYVDVKPEGYLLPSHRHEALQFCLETDSNVTSSGWGLQM